MTSNSSLYQERAGAVRQLVDHAREIEKTGVTHANLDKIGGLLAGLARRADLFPQSDFPLGSDGGIYRLSEDPDLKVALTLIVGLIGGAHGLPQAVEQPHFASGIGLAGRILALANMAERVDVRANMDAHRDHLGRSRGGRNAVDIAVAQMRAEGIAHHRPRHHHALLVGH